MIKTNIVVGVDIGGTNTKMGFVAKEGECINETRFKSQDYPGPVKFFNHLVSCITDGYNKLKNDYNLIGIGIGAPNGNYYRKTVENPPNLKWGIVDVAKILSASYEIPIAVTNDANATAIGELRFGSAKDMKDFIVITLGTGLGSGIVVNGKLVHGHDGFAGELGHTNYKPNGRLCMCGLRGCIETYASCTGIVRTALELLKKSPKSSKLKKIPNKLITSELIYEEALAGDKIALKCFDLTGKALGRMLANAIAVTDPEAIFLFGGLASAGDLIIEPTKKYFEQYLFTPYKNKVKILPSGLLNVNSAVLGAAALIWQELKN
ncbi:MAG: ROK family protein [Ignavibacteriaceae bacterium]